MCRQRLSGLRLTVAALVLTGAALSRAENIDPDYDGSQYAYGENVGWLNFEPSLGPGVQVSSGQLSGFVWGENIGWINLGPSTYGGVVNDGVGNLSGFAWGENVGWINFGPSYGGVSIDGAGDFDGWAWGENIGWINLEGDGAVAYKVKACVVSMDDLVRFATDWLEQGGEIGADLSGDEQVDLVDFEMMEAYWSDFCPDGWSL